jgi:hypothetical protein
MLRNRQLAVSGVLAPKARYIGAPLSREKEKRQCKSRFAPDWVTLLELFTSSRLHVWNPVEPDLKYSTSRAGLLGASFFLTPHLNTCRIALTRLLALSGKAIFQSRKTSTASGVIPESGKSRKSLVEPDETTEIGAHQYQPQTLQYTPISTV